MLAPVCFLIFSNPSSESGGDGSAAGTAAVVVVFLPKVCCTPVLAELDPQETLLPKPICDATPEKSAVLVGDSSESLLMVGLSGSGVGGVVTSSV